MGCNSTLFQAVRIIDVLFLGPAMIRVGNRIGGGVGSFVALAGIATIVFNGATFLDIEKERI